MRFLYIALWVVGLGLWAAFFWSLRRRAGPVSPDGERGLTEAARSLALTIHALAQDGALRQRIRQGYQN